MEGPQPPCSLTCCSSRVDHSVCRACRNRSGSWPGGTRQGLCRVHQHPPTFDQCLGAPRRCQPVPVDSGQSSPLPFPVTPAWPSCSAHWDGLLPTAWGSPGLMFQQWWAAGLRLTTPCGQGRGIGPQGQAHSTNHQGMPGGPPRPHSSMPCHSPRLSTAHQVWPPAPAEPLKWSRPLPPLAAPQSLPTHSPGPLLLAQVSSPTAGLLAGAGIPLGP